MGIVGVAGLVAGVRAGGVTVRLGLVATRGRTVVVVMVDRSGVGTSVVDGLRHGRLPPR
jgi:hypothetical protein